MNQMLLQTVRSIVALIKLAVNWHFFSVLIQMTEVLNQFVILILDGEHGITYPTLKQFLPSPNSTGRRGMWSHVPRQERLRQISLSGGEYHMFPVKHQKN